MSLSTDVLADTVRLAIKDLMDGHKAIVVSQVGGDKYITIEDNR